MKLWLLFYSKRCVDGKSTENSILKRGGLRSFSFLGIQFSFSECDFLCGTMLRVVDSIELIYILFDPAVLALHIGLNVEVDDRSTLISNARETIDKLRT